MNKFKRLTAIILVFLVFALTIPPVSVFADDSDMRYGRTKLSGNLQKLYDRLVDCYSNDTPTEVSIDKSWNISAPQLHYSFKIFYSDYPEYFWIVNGGYGWAAEGGTVVSFKPNYAISNVASAKSAYNAKVADLTKGLDGKSDYEKSKILHDRLIDTVTYTTTANDQNAYGALVEGKAVCNGYARAYQHLMNEVGVPTWYVSGNSINPSTGTPIGHAWNLAKLDGKWYYTDVTWDDQGTNTFYEYLNITTDKMTESHELDSDYTALVPKATATNANYYKVEGREFSKYDRNKLIDLLKNDDNSTQIYVNGDVNKFFDSFNSDLSSVGKQLGGKGSFQISYSATSLKNAIILTVAVISENHDHKVKTAIKQVDASCLTNGTKAHYICDCRLKFFDSACTKQVAGDSELTIPAVAHKSSDWKTDATCHWKECTVCGSEIANSRGNFTDKNKDKECDICGYAPPIDDKTGNIVVDNDITPNDNGSANNTSKPTDDNTPTNDGDNNHNGNEDTGDSNLENDNTTSEITSEIEETPDGTDSDNSDSSKMTWIIVGGAAALVITVGIVITVVPVKKK